MNVGGRDRRGLVEGLLLAFAFLLPLTISASEVLLLAAIPVWAWRERRGELRNIVRSPCFWPVVAFVAVAAVGMAWSVRPAVSLQRAHRLLFPFGMFVIGATCRVDRDGDGTRLVESVTAFAAGCAVRACYDLVRVPWEVSHGASLFDTGNMRDPQMYLVSLCLLLALAQSAATRPRRIPLVGAVLVLGMGLVLHFKRGVWISFCLAIGAMGCWTRRWGMLAALGLLIASSLFVPQVRHRIALLSQVTSTSTGGRLALWTEVAPVLLLEYPQGMGWSAVAHEDLTPHADYIQPRLNHLHNNLLQVALETGWAGLAVWIWWMAAALTLMWKNARDPAGDIVTCVSLGVLCAFLGLLANGMVEYNFGDTEILMLMCLLMGWAVAAAPRAYAGGGGNSLSSHDNSASRDSQAPSSCAS